MINEELIDYKLKELIRACKKSQNYKKLAVTCFILLNNRMNEIGLKLGIRLRNRKEDEKVYEYMAMINKISQDSFQIIFFNQELIKDCKRIELIFLRSKGDLNLQQVSEAFELYYDIRKLEVPNLHKKVNKSLLKGVNDVVSITNPFLNKGKGGDSNQVKNLILYKISKKEQKIRSQLNKKYSPELFESAIALQQAKASLERNNGNKITIRGSLKDNIVFKDSQYKLIGFFLLGMFIAFLLLGISMIYQAMENPLILDGIGSFLLMIFGLCLLIFFIYWNYFLKERR